MKSFWIGRSTRKKFQSSARLRHEGGRARMERVQIVAPATIKVVLRQESSVKSA